MGSQRIIITLPNADKAWLEGYSKAHNISVAEAVRQGISILRHASTEDTYQTLIKNTQGMWRKGDGLTYQDKIRSEWDS